MDPGIRMDPHEQELAGVDRFDFRDFHLYRVCLLIAPAAGTTWTAAPAPY
jgi:hypothetical protein